ncbi:alpha/beta hydrolase [Roseovarius sp. Pro17]|uniref:alpha/beta hydrolase n=1 Tax=Roseovarius sp. Pro17 TaxID=3108175 RepID=UPI002D78A28D|nr:alpha/beta fold hydrolase [Roseovarius sp. Pro17]
MTCLLRIDLKALTRSVFLLVFIAAAGCTPRSQPQALSVVPQGHTATRQVTITVATTRARDASTASYSDLRAPKLNYEMFTISIPPTHKISEIEWPKSQPNPQTSFAVTDRRELPDFALNAGKRDILIFVHGYNYTFAESLFRLAQVAADADLKESPVLFAWPSAASVTGYVADKDAVTYSRDDLVHLLTVVAADPAIENITLFGHSMGGWLVAEALRQLRLSGQHKVIDRLGNVVLAAPDIDIDVFRRQVQTIGKLNPPITLLVSPDDRALKLSERLAGSRGRVGTRDANDPRVQALAAAHGIRVIDISKVDAPDGSNHNRFAALMKVLPRATKTTFASLAHAGSFILEPASATLVSSNK